MFSGNKAMAQESIRLAAFESLKDTFACQNINWESKSCERAVKDFNELAILIAAAVVINITDAGDIPYVSGRPTKLDIQRGLGILISHYTSGDLPNAKYADKKTKAFKRSFEAKIKKLSEQWERKVQNLYRR